METSMGRKDVMTVTLTTEMDAVRIAGWSLDTFGMQQVKLAKMLAAGTELSLGQNSVKKGSSKQVLQMAARIA